MAKSAKRNGVGGGLLFEISTPIGFSVRCTAAYWEFIATQKHPVMAGQEREVEQTLGNPDEVRRSRTANDVFLFYRGGPLRWICAVARRQNGEGFLITAYPTDAIKAGARVWTKSE